MTVPFHKLRWWQWRVTDTPHKVVSRLALVAIRENIEFPAADVNESTIR